VSLFVVAFFCIVVAPQLGEQQQPQQQRSFYDVHVVFGFYRMFVSQSSRQWHNQTV
jgi:hypothetical protein